MDAGGHGGSNRGSQVNSCGQALHMAAPEQHHGWTDNCGSTSTVHLQYTTVHGGRQAAGGGQSSSLVTIYGGSGNLLCQLLARTTKRVAALRCSVCSSCEAVLLIITRSGNAASYAALPDYSVRPASLHCTASELP